MSWDGLRWHQVRRMRFRAEDPEGWHDQSPTPENHRARTHIAHERLAAHCDGALVARSQILVSGSTATLLGTVTNETGCFVYFSGVPPYAVTFETDGGETILMGDFSSAPRAKPSSGDCVMHPGACVPYRSLPVVLRNPRPRWDGSRWSFTSHATTLDKTFYNQRQVPTIHLFGKDCPWTIS